MTDEQKLWLGLGVAAVGLGLVMRQRAQTPAPIVEPEPTIGDDPVLAQLQAETPKPIRDLAQAIALAEGFGIDGAIPTRRHNPGDLVDASGMIREFPDDASGWRALYRQLGIIVDGGSHVYDLVDDTIGSMGRKWTLTEQDAWIANVLRGLRQLGYSVDANTPLSAVLT